MLDTKSSGNEAKLVNLSSPLVGVSWVVRAAFVQKLAGKF
jgi:hypothetical protein